MVEMISSIVELFIRTIASYRRKGVDLGSLAGRNEEMEGLP
jgi:hypothetical protein